MDPDKVVLRGWIRIRFDIDLVITSMNQSGKENELNELYKLRNVFTDGESFVFYWKLLYKQVLLES